MIYLQPYLNEIRKLCESHNVKHLFAFGSVISERFSSKSDVDLVVDFQDQNPVDYADNYFDLKYSLEKLLKREIDLLEERAMRNPYLKQQIEKHKVALYGH